MSTVRKIPMRKCVGCGEMKSKKEMLRVLKTTEDEIILDATGRKNGRGAYLCFDKGCLEKCSKVRKGFSGACGRGRIGQHKKIIQRYVYVLRSTFL